MPDNMGEVRRICPFVGVMTGVRLSTTDPIGCPVTISEMLDYVRPLLSFEVFLRRLRARYLQSRALISLALRMLPRIQLQPPPGR
jgi:hypothetical protein